MRHRNHDKSHNRICLTSKKIAAALMSLGLLLPATPINIDNSSYLGKAFADDEQPQHTLSHQAVSSAETEQAQVDEAFRSAFSNTAVFDRIEYANASGARDSFSDSGATSSATTSEDNMIENAGRYEIGSDTSMSTLDAISERTSEMGDQSVGSDPFDDFGDMATASLSERYGIEEIDPQDVEPITLKKLGFRIAIYNGTSNYDDKVTSATSNVSGCYILKDEVTMNSSITNIGTALIPVDAISDLLAEYGYTPSLWAMAPFRRATNGNYSGDSSTSAYHNMRYVSYNNQPYLKAYISWSSKNVNNLQQGDKNGWFKYIKLTEVDKLAYPSDTTINVFDYWVTPNRYDNDRYDYTASDNDKGINNGHSLKFGWKMYNNIGAINSSPNVSAPKDSMVTSHIVEPVLVDGYPYLATNRLDSRYNQQQESLAYLFDPDIDETKSGAQYQEGKKAFSNVGSFLQQDSEGYYYYNAHVNGAWFDEYENRFHVYNEPVVKQSTNTNIFTSFTDPLNGDTVPSNGSFFPFTDPHRNGAWASNNSNCLNHYFGFTMSTHFFHQYGGHTESTMETPAKFHFAGDDDVWVFIDNVLVGDAGGVHSRSSLDINFQTGEVAVWYVDDYDNTAANRDKIDANKVLRTTIREAFANAGKEGEKEWNGDTFADNTSHVLKFFYMERGNTNSNLELKFNMLQIPHTSIYKVDQDGCRVPGAGFAVYPAFKDANGDYLYRDEITYSEDEDGNQVQNPATYLKLPKNHELSEEDGTITYYDDSSGTTKHIYPAFVGWTDSNGEMLFGDRDGNAYTMSDLSAMFGDTFILREFRAPNGYRAGYRLIEEEAHMRFYGGCMFCDNQYECGVWASNNALVSAPQQLCVANEYTNNATTLMNSSDEMSSIISPHVYSNGTNSEIHQQVQYYTRDSDTGIPSVNGTLFAVVLKRDDRNYDRGLGGNFWFPIYGTDEYGYYAVRDGVPDEPSTEEEWDQLSASPTNCPLNIEAVISAAKSQRNISGDDSLMFAPAAGSTNIQLMFEHLPGKIDRYYQYLYKTDEDGVVEDDEAGLNPQYILAYYWTPGTLDEATADNTLRVYARPEIVPGYSGFSAQWSTTINFPNIINRLYFQRKNDEEEWINNDIIALYHGRLINPPGDISEGRSSDYMYEVEIGGRTVYADLFDSNDKTNTNGDVIIYDADGNELASGGTYTINSETGEIAFVTPLGNASIFPARNAMGEECINVTTDYQVGTGLNAANCFSYLIKGEYILRELGTPEDNLPNTRDVPVSVKDTGVYAYAGDPDFEYDRVRVANGAGYLMKTLKVFATQNEIDETLRWICIVTNNSVVNAGDHGDYVSGLESFLASNPNWADKALEHVTSYLEYGGDAHNTEEDHRHIFNYFANEDQSERYDNGVLMANEGTGTLWHWTEYGWASLSVFQDYLYGIQHTDTRAFYEDIRDQWDITNLFSNFTMVQLSSPKLYGDIDVTCYVHGNDADPEHYFTYTVTLDDRNVNATYGDMTFVNGVAQFQLKHGETKTTLVIDPETGKPVNHIFANTKYTVVQTDDEGYDVVYVNEVGEIPDGDVVHVIFWNYKSKVIVPMSGDGGLWILFAIATLLFGLGYRKALKMFAEQACDDNVEYDDNDDERIEASGEENNADVNALASIRSIAMAKCGQMLGYFFSDKRDKGNTEDDSNP